jgi:hypothetical protein
MTPSSITFTKILYNKHMLEKIITDLKKSLSGSSKKKGEEDDVESDEDAESQEESEDNDSSDKDKKKAQTSMLIRVLIILGLGYVALDHFVLNSNDGGPTPEEIMARAPKKRKPIVKKEVAGEGANVSAENASPSSSSPAPSDEKSNSEGAGNLESSVSNEEKKNEAPVENINILDKDQAPVVASEQPNSQAGEDQENIDKRIDRLIETADQNEPKAPAVEEVFVPNSSAADSEAKKPSKASMADLIVEDDVFVPPPQYDQIGRGLVYNCKEKYWACIDKPSYVACNKNMKWNKSKGNPGECVVQNVYGSDEDCAKVQKYNVSTNQSTDFCK